MRDFLKILGMWIYMASMVRGLQGDKTTDSLFYPTKWYIQNISLGMAAQQMGLIREIRKYQNKS